jgi:hypothetical protein
MRRNEAALDACKVKMKNLERREEGYRAYNKRTKLELFTKYWCADSGEWQLCWDTLEQISRSPISDEGILALSLVYLDICTSKDSDIEGINQVERL